MTTSETKTKKPKAAKTKVSRVSSKSKTARAGEEGKVVLRIRVRAYESKILDASVKQIMDTPSVMMR